VRKKRVLWSTLALLMVVPLLASACGQNTVEVTRVVTEKETVIQTVVETVMDKETVIVEGTPQVVEQEVEVTRVVEKVVTAEPVVEEVVEIEFGPWDYPSSSEAMHAIIESFERAYPGIKVNYVGYPYEEYNEKIAALVPAGQGPDIVKPYYGWIPAWKDAGFIIPLPEEDFPNERFETEFPPLINTIKLDGQWWGMPLSVRSMGMFYRKDQFREAGVEKVPTNWDEWLDAILKLSEWDAQGNLIRSGMDVSGGSAHWLFMVLLMQNGQPPLSEDYRTVQWNASEAGYEAWQWLTDIEFEYNASEEGMPGGYEGMCSDVNAMFMSHVGHIGRVRTDCPEGVDWGTFELPAGPQGKANFGTFWPLAITSKAAKDPKKLDAAIKFLQFAGSRDAQVAFASYTGELPALIEVANEPLFVDNPLLAPFIKQLDVAFSYFYVDEKEERDIFINAWAKLSEGQEPRQVLDETVAELQAVRDAYFENH
jgi:multiple sugar transport system substrate-binding protein